MPALVDERFGLFTSTHSEDPPLLRLVCDRWNPVTLLANQMNATHTSGSRNLRQVRAAVYSSRIAVTGFRRIARRAGR